MRTIKFSSRLALVAVLGFLGGCLYSLPIQQGNVLNPDLVSQLEPGMTRSQVMFLLGTPMIPNGFNTDRWDYYFYVKAARGRANTDSKRLTVWFKDEKVDHLEGDAAPKPKTSPTPVAG